MDASEGDRVNLASGYAGHLASKITADGDFKTPNKNLNDHATETFNFLYDLWKERKLCDLVISCDNREFWAHRVALAPHSDYFAARFKELKATDVAQLSVNDTQPEAVQAVLEYIYTAKLPINSNNVEAVLSCADQLGIDSVISRCKDILLNFNTEKVLSFMAIAEKYNLADVQERAYRYISDNFSAVAKSQDFLESKIENLLQFLMDDNLSVLNELEVFYIALSWIEHERRTRVDNVSEIMGACRLGLIPPEDLHNHVESVDYIADCPEVAEMMFEAYKYHALKNLPQAIPRELIPMQRKWLRKASVEKPKCKTKAQHTLVNSPRDGDWSDTEMLNIPGTHMRTRGTPIGTPLVSPRPANGRRTGDPDPLLKEDRCRSVSPRNNRHRRGRNTSSHPIESPPLRLPKVTTSNTVELRPAPHSTYVPSKYMHNVKCHPKTILVIGGIDMDHPKEREGRSTFLLTHKGKQWSELADLPTALHHHIIFVIEQCVYVVGGSIVDHEQPDAIANPTNTLYKYDSRVQRWQQGPNMYYKRMYHSVAVVNKMAFVIGGQNEKDEYMNVVECFDSRKNKWSRCRSMSRPRIGMATDELNGLIYTVGGFNDKAQPYTISDSVDVFNPLTNKWSSKNPLDTARCHAAMVNCNDKLYLAGGVTKVPHRKGSVTSLSSVEVYDEKQDIWEYITDMSVPKHDFGISALGSKIYVIGGYSTARNKAESTVECYDVTTGTWEKQIPRLNHAAVGLKVTTFADPTTNAEE